MTADGMNYRFDSSDTPGAIYIPYHGRVSGSRVRSKFMEFKLTDVFVTGV